MHLPKNEKGTILVPIIIGILVLVGVISVGTIINPEPQNSTSQKSNISPSPTPLNVLGKKQLRKQIRKQNKPKTTTGSFTCSGKKSCSQMVSCAEAQFYLKTCGVSSLDGDKDGVPCEKICK